jgi:hypothetical protein
MKKQLGILGILAILVCVGLSGCNQISNLFLKEEDKFVGTWHNQTEVLFGNNTFTFFSDRTLTFSQGPLSFHGTYEIKDGKLVTKFQGEIIESAVYTYSFSDNNTKLSLTEVGTNTTLVYTKQ